MLFNTILYQIVIYHSIIDQGIMCIYVYVPYFITIRSLGPLKKKRICSGCPAGEKPTTHLSRPAWHSKGQALEYLASAGTVHGGRALAQTFRYLVFMGSRSQS